MAPKILLIVPPRAVQSRCSPALRALQEASGEAIVPSAWDMPSLAIIAEHASMCLVKGWSCVPDVLLGRPGPLGL